MRGVLKAFGVVAFWIACFVLAANVTNRLGREWGFALVGLTFGAAWSGLSDRSRWFMGLFWAAVDRHLSNKEAAYLADSIPATVSNWRSGREQAPMPRLMEFPDVVWEDFCKTYLEDRGFVVIESGRVADLTQAVRALDAAVRAHGTVTMPRQGAA